MGVHYHLFQKTVVLLLVVAVVLSLLSSGAWVVRADVEEAAPPASLAVEEPPAEPKQGANVTPLASLNLISYTGTWYEIAVGFLPKYTFEAGCTCTFAQYELASPNGDDDDSDSSDESSSSSSDESSSSESNSDEAADLFVLIQNGCKRFGQETTISAVGFPAGAVVGTVIAPAVLKVAFPDQGAQDDDLKVQVKEMFNSFVVENASTLEKMDPTMDPREYTFDLDSFGNISRGSDDDTETSNKYVGDYLVLWAVDFNGDGVLDLAVVSAKKAAMGLWFLARERSISPAQFQLMKDNAILAGVSPALLEPPFFFLTDQSNCNGQTG